MRERENVLLLQKEKINDNKKSYAFGIMTILFVIIACMSAFWGDSSTRAAVTFLFFAYYAIEYIEKYICLRAKKHLLIGIMSILLGIFQFIEFIFTI